MTPSFTAYLSLEDVKSMFEIDFISDITKVSDDPGFVTSYSDLIIGNEVLPWFKQEVNANDQITSQNIHFIVDLPFASSVLDNEINFVYRENLGTGASHHPASVISIVGGKTNNQLTRGINPNQPIVQIGLNGSNTSTVAHAIHHAASVSEWFGVFGTLSLSFNSPGNRAQSENNFNYSSVFGLATRRASSRFFVSQSAGNNDSNACLMAFNYNGTSLANDGVIVVGGTNSIGERYELTPNPAGYYNSEPRSNFGQCIEAWAPGNKIAVATLNGNVINATGTSFSAPIVGAIASRYGDSFTRPIEREQYIKNSLMSTGYYAGGSPNLPIQLAKYTNPSQHSIPKRLPVINAYSQTNTANLALLYDQKFFDAVFWNANANWGSILLDLGSPRQISGVRVHIRSSATSGNINFAVHGGNSITVTAPNVALIPDNPIAYSNVADQYDLVPYYIPASGMYRYIRVDGNNFNSHLAYSEVEVYGQ